MVVHVYNPIWEGEAWRLKVYGQPGLHSETLLQKESEQNENQLQERKDMISWLN